MRVFLWVALRVKACHGAATFIQSANRIDAAAKPHVQMQAVGRRVFTQAGQRVIVAGVKGQHMGIGVECDCKGPLQIGAQGLELRR